DAARRPGPPPARLRADAARERARRGPPPPPQAADRGGRPAESERPRVLPERWLRVLRRGRARLRPPRALGARRRPRASAGNHSVSEIYGVFERPGARVVLRPFAPGDEAGFVACYNRVFPRDDPRVPPMTAAEWRWKYALEPTGRREIMVAV